MFLSSHAILKSISIHAPAKGATKWIAKNPEAYAFQSTLPRRERRCIYPLVIYCSLFQSTLPRRERRTIVSKLDELLTISIHAPAKGATGLFSLWKVDKIISIHAPAKGATINVAWSQLIDKFQSTLPRRERRYNKW